MPPPVEADPAARLLELLSRQIVARQEAAGLPPGQWAILRYLSKAAYTARSVADIGRYLGTEVSIVRRALSALSRKGLVEIASKNAANGSGLCTLSSLGLEFAAKDPVVRLCKAIDRIELAQRAHFVRCLELIIDDLSFDSKPR